MKRLTKRFERVVCYIGKNKQNDEDTAAEMSVPAIRDVLGKLAEYEDTGLEPEELEYIARAKRGERMVTDEELRQAGVSQTEIDRLFEIAVAESEGRLLVLPCKVGDTVYWVRGTAVLQVYVEWFETNTYGWCVCGRYPPINPTFKFDDFGKSVFLTREEAEAALRKEHSSC